MNLSVLKTKTIEYDKKQLSNLLEANLKTLADTRPSVYARIATFLKNNNISYSNNDGDIFNTTLHVNNNSYRFDHNTVANNIENISTIFSDKSKLASCFLYSIGSGLELIHIFELTDLPIPELPNAIIPLYITIPNIEYFLLALSIFEFNNILASDRLIIFMGEKAAEDFNNFICSTSQVYLPYLYFNFALKDAIGLQPFAKIIRERVAFLQTKNMQLLRKIKNYYDNLSSDFWLKRFTLEEHHEPLRVMAVTSRFSSFIQYCMRDLLAGFKSIGCETKLIIEESDIYRINASDIYSTFQEFKPDLIIYINHFRSNQNYFIHKNIPFVNWIQDLLPNITENDNLNLSQRDFTFVFVTDWIKHLGNKPAFRNHPIHFLPLGVNQDIYYPRTDVRKEFDILYVSHLVNPQLTFEPFRNSSIKFQMTTAEENIINAGLLNEEELFTIYQTMLKKIDGNAIDFLWREYSSKSKSFKRFIIESVKSSKTRNREMAIDFFLKPSRLTVDLNFTIKTRPIKKLRSYGYDIGVYGNYWNVISGLESSSHGIARNGEHLNVLMNQARICINNSPGTSFHMRALEILGSGSFMLSRRIPLDNMDITEFFSEGNEVVFFDNEYDVADKVKYYLENEQERKNIAYAAHKKAVTRFSYKAISQNLLDTIKRDLSGGKV